MMRWMLAFVFSLFASCASAQVCAGGVPFSFVNGTTIDATQVNANFQALLSCVNSNAASKTSVSQAAPTGLIGYFNAVSCPSGWVTADGSGGTTDVRGYYVRAQDLSSGRDPYAPAVGASEGPVNGPITASITGTAQGQVLNGTGAYAQMPGLGVNFTATGNTTATAVVNVITGTGFLNGSVLELTSSTLPVAVSGTVNIPSYTGLLFGTSSASSVSGSASCTNCNTQLAPKSIILLACSKL